MKHRPLDLRRFVAAIPDDLLRRYFDAIHVPAPGGWAELNGDALEEWLSQPDQGDVEPLVRQHFRRINDLTTKSMSVVSAAYQKYEMTKSSQLTAEAHALVLFLDCPEGFEYAWSRYLLYANAETLTDYYFPARKVDLDAAHVQALTFEFREFFERQAKGKQCRVKVFEDKGEIIVVIQRGHHMRTISMFDGESDEVAFRTFRPVIDDLLVFDPAEEILRIKATTQQEREAYLWHFAGLCPERENLVRNALDRKLYSLEPLQSGAFDFTGDSQDVLEVRWVRARFQLGRRASVEYRADDVRALIGGQEDVLRSGLLVSASLLFTIRDGKNGRPVRCDITPPARGRLPEDYTDIVASYLRQQGVKLK